MLPGLVVPFVGLGKSIEFVNYHYFAYGSNQTTHTFSSVSIGADSPSRKLMVLCVAADPVNTPTITTITVAGASPLSESAGPLGGTGGVRGYQRYGIFSATGATADVVITIIGSSSAQSFFCAIWKIDDSGSIIYTNTNSRTSTAATLNVTLTSTADSYGFVFAGQGTTGTDCSFSCTDFTEVYDLTYTGIMSVAAYVGVQSGVASNSVTVTNSSPDHWGASFMLLLR